MKNLLVKSRFSIVPLYAIFLFLVACGSNQIITDKFEGYSQAQSGEPVTIKWKFKNANKVEIDKVPGKAFKIQDSLQMAFDKSETLNFTILKTDSTLFSRPAELKLPWTVKVAEKIIEPIQRGPLEKVESKIGLSKKPSAYLIGVSGDENQEPVRLKILNANMGKETFIKAALIDANGNLAVNDKTADVKNWKISINCEDKAITPAINSVKASKFDGAETPVNFKILVDYSAEATGAHAILTQTKKFAGVFKGNDIADLVLFNQKIVTSIPLDKNIEEGYNSIFDVKPSGLNASYKAIHKSLRNASDNGAQANKALVLITQGNDNSSILYTAADCIELANQANFPIYVVAIGDYAESYLFQPLCDKTGGAYYELGVGETDKLSDLLTEIYASINNYIKIDIASESVKGLAESLSYNVMLDYKSSKSTLSAELLKTHMFMPPFPRYQAVAAFDENSSELSPEYDETLSSLAMLLKDNPNGNIELVSHRRNSEDDKIDEKRAQKIWDVLFENGVSATNQIKLRNDGAKSPINFYENEDWQKLYNRRVDLRWLLSDQMPFEISLETEKSEELALKKVALWEKRGFKSYFDRIINSEGEPVYKIKLWGYKTIALAEEAAELIFKKFKAKSEIE